MPADVLRLDNALVMRTRLYDASWTEGKLHLTGHAFPEHLGAEHRSDMVKVLVLREAKGRRVLALPAKAQYSPEATSSSPHDLYSCDWAGFRAVIDPKRLKHRGEWREGSWRVLIAGIGKGGVYKGRISGGWSDRAEYPPVHWVEDDVRVVPWLKDNHVNLRVEKVRARAAA
ncbi:hypothetical protein ACFQ1I_18990 [Kitasatospora arboriphila]